MAGIARLTQRQQQQETSVELIDAAKAEEYLQCNTHNRSISEATVEALAVEMREGRWRLHHQGIAFDSMGVLRDGQHRLHAILIAKKPVPMVVTRGIDPAVFDTIDAHRPRTVGDQLHLQHGLTAGKRISAVAAVIMFLEEDRPFGRKLTIGATLNTYNRHQEGIEEAMGLVSAGIYARAPVLGPIAFAYRTGKTKAITFATQVRDGEHLSKKDPAYVLREFVKNKQISSTTDRRIVTVAVLRCLYAFYAEQPLEVIRQNQLLDSEMYAKMQRYFMRANLRAAKAG